MTLGAMVGTVSSRLNEGASGPVFYPRSKIVDGIDEGLRLFALLTLCLETTQPWALPAATTFFHMLSTFADWIVPLRIAAAPGAKVRPASTAELTSLDPAWWSAAGSPIRYAALGADFVGLYRQPASTGTTLQVTYARAPVAVTLDADVPEIPIEYHPELVNYAIYYVRQVEGGQEFAKVLPLLGGFLDAAQKHGEYVRARNLAHRYDTAPFELKAFDRSKLLKLRADLVPARKVSE